MTTTPSDYKPTLNQPKNPGLVIGIIAIVLGLFAIVAPNVSTLVFETWAAFILLSVGFSNTIYAFKSRPEGYVWQAVLGLLYVGTGVLLLVYPLTGVLTLTLLLGSFLLTEGVFESVLAFKLRPRQNWQWVLANGIITLILGLSVWFSWPQNAPWTIGTLVGVSILATGVSRVMLALAGPSVDSTASM